MPDTQEEQYRDEVADMMQDLLKAGIPNDTLLDMILEIREEANGNHAEIVRKVRQLHEPVVEMNRLTDEMLQAGADAQKLSETIKQIQTAAGNDHVQLMAGMRELHQRIIGYARNGSSD